MHLCVLCGSENKQRFFSLYSINLSVFITEAECLLRGTNWVFKLDRYSFVLKGLTSACVRNRLLTYFTLSALEVANL